MNQSVPDTMLIHRLRYIIGNAFHSLGSSSRHIDIRKERVPSGNRKSGKLCHNFFFHFFITIYA